MYLDVEVSEPELVDEVGLLGADVQLHVGQELEVIQQEGAQLLLKVLNNIPLLREIVESELGSG